MDSHDAQCRVDALLSEIFLIRNPDCLPPRERKPMRNIATVRAELRTAREELERIRGKEDFARVQGSIGR